MSVAKGHRDYLAEIIHSYVFFIIYSFISYSIFYKDLFLFFIGKTDISSVGKELSMSGNCLMDHADQTTSAANS